VTELLIMVAIALIGWKGGERIGLFGAAILGPLILAAILSLTDVMHYRPPAEAILAAQYFIGIGIGVHYVGVTWRELRRTWPRAWPLRWCWRSWPPGLPWW
jgi:uncharacterized protein